MLLDGLKDRAPRTSLWLPGTNGNYMSAAYSSGIDFAGDIDIRWIGSLDDWTPAVTTSLVNRWAGSSLNLLYLQVETSGNITFGWSPTLLHANSKGHAVANPGFVNGTIQGIRVNLDVDNGAGQYTVTFNTSSDLGETWVPLGSPINGTTGPTSLGMSESIPLTIGGTGNGTFTSKGRTLKAEVRNGINGTVVASPDFTAPVGPRSRDAQGNIWTINGSAWAWKDVA